MGGAYLMGGGKKMPGRPTKKNKTYTYKPAGLKNEDGGKNVVAQTTGHVSHNKRVALKKKRTVKVSKSFKEKVVKASLPDSIHGEKTDFYYPTFNSVISNFQTVGWGYDSGTVQSEKWSFLPEYFLDAASVLWNNKAATASSYSLSSTDTLGKDAVTSANTLKFTIKNSFEHYLFKNNTSRGFKIKLYECAPKRPSTRNSTGATITGGTVVNGDALLVPQTYWGNALADDFSEGVNLSNVGNNAMDATPNQSSSFSKGYAIGCTEVFLEPGASYSYFLQGPSNVEFDMAKYFTGTMFMDIQKYSRYLLPVYKSELMVNSVGQQFFGRFGHTPTQPGYSLLGCERKLYCSLKMPEQTGFVAGAAFVAGQKINLTKRRHAYSYNMWNTGTATGPFGTTAEQTEISIQS